MKETIPSRRIVLRGALALGCGMWLPIALSGCDSKKGANSGASTPGATPSAAGSKGAAAPAAVKVSQASVQYQTQPKGELKCKDCANFIAESSTCKVVEGQISPDGWCTMWTKKA